jgi:hypothetical protein
MVAGLKPNAKEGISGILYFSQEGYKLFYIFSIACRPNG